ncbi:S53 family peptidase [Xanthomonas campestris]|uniref:S53 family peptidase n=1 Tax=Xanthomonas campestris TaxID=339 RepID=UPI0002F41439|nr:S53 family peptidase [Xanthomonas campestris]MCD0252492.1 S8/S53 family peptidase [Xanthomonas campestris pv. campestris]MEA0763349.1 S53 family peptidase [Xanthomonas campestris pv. campestris]MEA9598140.1 S53 family peptidase [Xanthomonas campestris]MEB1225133.1 S53 family peptidase [Xanthomonas campestris pv. campestris]MEB1245809.1 S53 family peptidase [Xanthomonas campestris pv. campestris]
MIDRIRSRSVLATALFVSLCAFGNVYAAPQTTFAATTATLRAAPVHFDVHLPLRDQAELDALLAEMQDPVSPHFHHWLSPNEFARRFGPDSKQVDRVRSALQDAHMSVVQQGATLQVSAGADMVERMFSTPLEANLSASGHAKLAAASPLQLPAALRDSGAVVTGLTGGVQSYHVHSTRLRQVDPQNRRGQEGYYSYNDLKQAYGYPSYQSMIGPPGKQRRLDGTGTTIAILISSDVLDSDVDAMFNAEKFSRYADGHVNPKLYARRYVAGAKPGVRDDNEDEASEAALDVQMALAGAPGAHVLLYVIPELSYASLIAGYRQIVQDNEADVVSSSFGGCELLSTKAYNGGTDYTAPLRTMNAIFKQGNAQGMSFIASSGDSGGLACPDMQYAVDGKDGKYVAGVEHPAADPYVTAVGGGNLRTRHNKGSLDSSYLSESAYADPMVARDGFGVGALLSGGYWGSGGGVSTLFQRPAYQLRALGGTRSSMRALPDVGMLVGGCPNDAIQPCKEGRSPFSSSVLAVFKGTFYTNIGTSVAAPEFASVAALLVEKQGRQGNLNDYLYRLAANFPQAFHRGIPGNNGVVNNDIPLPGTYNYTVGLGTPVVRLLIGAPDAAPAGVPRSPSNP